jgi:hypothetical protein
MIAIAGLPTCGARELVRVVGVDDRSTEWAIVGKGSRDYFPLIYLTGQNAPFVLNAMIAPFLQERPIVKYGTAWRLMADHTKTCSIATMSKEAGTMLLAGEDWYLVTNKYNERGQRWFHVATGEVQGEPGNHQAEFSGWKLLIDGLKEKETEIAICAR